MSNLKRVLVVDDAALMRLVVKNLLVHHPVFEVIGQARDGLDALEKVAELQPDLLTLDLEMPNLNGLEVLSRLKVSHPHVKIIVLSHAEDRLDAARRGGADGVFLKPSGNVSFDLVENSGPQIVETMYLLMGLEPPEQ